MAAAVNEKPSLKFAIAIPLAVLWVLTFWASAKLVYPINSLSAAIVESWRDTGFISAWNNSYYPPLWPALGILFVKLGLNDVLWIQMVTAGIMIALTFLAFYRSGALAFFVGFAAFLFSPAFLYGALNFWRETVEIFALLIITAVFSGVEKKRGNPYLLGVIFGVPFGLGLLAKWTFWVYPVAFGIAILLALTASQRWKFLIISAITAAIIALPWYLLKLDVKTLVETTKNDPSLCCPTFLSRFVWYCKELFNVCGYGLFAFLIVVIANALRRPKGLLFIFGILLSVAVLSMPVHIEIRYLVPLAVLVAAGFLDAASSVNFSKASGLALIAIFATSLFLEEGRLVKNVDEVASEDFVDVKKFLISALPAMKERVGEGEQIAFNPLFPVYFGKAVEFASGAEKLKIYSPEFFDMFRDGFMKGEYKIVINLVPVDVDTSNPEQVVRLSYAKGGRFVMGTTGNVVYAPSLEGIKETLDRLKREYRLIFEDTSYGERIEIWERKK